MKRTLTNYWEMFKSAFPFLIILWAMGLISYATIKIFDPEILPNLNTSVGVVIALIFTLVTVPIHSKFKK